MKSWAIVVGINEYHPDAGQQALNGAVADAADFADWALHPQGGAVDPSRLFFWTHPLPANPTPTLAAYLAAPTRWYDLWNVPGTPDFSRAPVVTNITETALRAGRAASAAAMGAGNDETRRVYVFFAGHGVQTNTTGSTTEIQTCFVVGDFRPDSSTVTGLVPCEDFRRALLGGGFDQVFMFLDCCRVAMPKLNMPAPTIGSPNSRIPPQPIWGVGNAAQKNKVAYETTAPPLRGAFSKTLLDGLRTVRDPANQTLTLDSLKVYVRDNIGACTANEQRPNFIADPDDPPPVVLTGPPIPFPQTLADIRITFGALAVGTIVQLCNAKGEKVGGPIVAAPGGVTIQAIAGQFYSLDVAGANISTPFKHPGPGVTVVPL
jgi:hypothetical protein